MAIRMSGLVSNMDTDTIVKQLMSAQSMKRTKLANKKTELEWTQDKWKDLNTKIYKFYTDQVSNLRLVKSYQSKSASSSDETKATATSTTGTPGGNYTLQINALASTQYATSGKLSQTGITTSSKLVSALGMQSGTVINFTSGTGTSAKSATLDVDANTTIDDFLKKCTTIGLKASYDTTQKRFFISSAESGAANTYNITSSTYANASDVTYRDNLRNLAGYSKLSSTDQTTVDSLINTIRDGSQADMNYVTGGSYDATTATDAQKQLKSSMDQLNTYLTQAAKNAANTYATYKVSSNINDAIKNGTSYGGKDYSSVSSDMWNNVVASQSDPKPTLADAEAAFGKTADTRTAAEKNLASLYSNYQTKVNSLVATDIKSTDNVNNINTLATDVVNNGVSDGDVMISKLSDLKNNLNVCATSLAGATITAGTSSSSQLSNLGLGEITSDIATNGYTSATGMNVVKAADSKIVLNGAELTGTTNTIVANGLTINLKAKTEGTSTMNLTVSDNSQGTYDMVKKFVTEYNALLKEMNTDYYASTAKGYEPLTDDQKQAMTDDQVTQWEKKIKDSLLRRDDKLGSLTSAMKSSLMGNVEVDGKRYSLASFGIQTSDIDYDEKGLLHIYGDKTDATYGSKDDKLLKAIQDDPDKVAAVLSGLVTKLSDTMQKKMKSSSLNSALTFYNDKDITKQLTAYTKNLKTMDTKLSDMENKYYKQFSAMETAMAKLNSQQSSLSSMLSN
jgi:Flagellar capping protein